MSEIIELLIQKGFTEEEADKTFKRWYNWLNDSLKSKPIADHFNAIEDSKYDQLIIVKDIDANLICPHHLLPVIMRVHIGYVPDGKILGLSKFARIAKDLTMPMTQEEYTSRIVGSIMDNLTPKFVMEIVEGEHTCMRVRGIESKNSVTITNAIRCNLKEGALRSYKEELMRAVRLDA